ncbi:phosphoenolpyruvate--protein phosphotransferase [Bifidobacterium aquikefiricola]|uniref:Phosphoenolpyruvate-protein phosphotransferase n=1 Tax=Bifidobacterium aquikefiricola TaxID=3059038 RepID=A0AB39U842_9BIFI
MKILKGTGVSAGIAMGAVRFLSGAEHSEHRVIDNVDSEIGRLHDAMDAAVSQLDALYRKTAGELGEDKAELFRSHSLMLKDPDFTDQIESIIRKHVNAEAAVQEVGERFASVFAKMDNAYMKERASDVKDVSQRVIGILEGTGNADMTFGEEPLIIAAENLVPSQTAQLDRNSVMGFVTSQGSTNSHTAILARTMGLPAIIGVGDALNSDVEGHVLAIDGFTGEVVIDPDPDTMKRYELKNKQYESHIQMLKSLKGKKTETRAGQTVRLFANIGRPSDMDAVMNNDAEGIGLFRSEFLYLESEDFPSEETQFKAYREVAERMQQKQVVIRTLDIGADKQADYFGLKAEENPALGYRAIRICLTEPEIFKVQLRAILRASAYGNVAIMLPMITSVQEVLDAKAIVEEVKTELDDKHIDFNHDMQVGIMIETPASVIMAEELAAEVDFFSIGTNDLTQYTLACDRQNANLTRFADPHSPAVLRMISMAAEAAHHHDIWCGICGELGADPSLTQTFLNIGIDELSVSPSSILPLRKAILEA